jgi:nucleotide-binding universal stress UspA family protein
MFQRILVPLDGSLRAERALPLAAHLARASQGMLILLRVVSAVAEDDPETPSQSLVMRTLAQTQMEEADRYLTALASSQALKGIPLTVAALPGRVVSTILAAIQTYQADLLVLCAQRNSPGQSEVIGGLAGQLTEHIDIPFLLVPERGSFPFTAHARQEHPISVLVEVNELPPAHTLVQSASSLLVALNDRGLGHLHFVPTCASGRQPPGTVAFHFHRDNRQFSIAKSETTQARARGVLLKERESRTEKPSGGEDADLLVLEMPAKPRRREWMLQRNQRCGASEENIAFLIVPSPGAEYKEW